MLAVRGEVVVDRSPSEVLDWVGDLERYRRADTKITKVLHQDERTVRYRGRLRGIPTPADVQTVEVVPGRSLTFRGAPGHWTRRLLDFEGGFAVEAVEGGTRVVHSESYTFKPAPVRWAAEAFLRRWLQRDMAGEMARLKALVEASPRPDGP